MLQAGVGRAVAASRRAAAANTAKAKAAEALKAAWHLGRHQYAAADGSGTSGRSALRKPLRTGGHRYTHATPRTHAKKKKKKKKKQIHRKKKKKKKMSSPGRKALQHYCATTFYLPAMRHFAYLAFAWRHRAPPACTWRAGSMVRARARRARCAGRQRREDIYMAPHMALAHQRAQTISRGSSASRRSIAAGGIACRPNIPVSLLRACKHGATPVAR